MRIDILARRWGGPEGGGDGMSVAASFLAWTLCDLGHEVRGYREAPAPVPWEREGMQWRSRAPLSAPDDWAADLVVTTISATWRRTALAAALAHAHRRLIYWHHHGGLPESFGCPLAAPPAIVPTAEWSPAIVLPPSSWAVEARGERTGGEILVPGAGPAKGGRVAHAVAELCPDLRWYVLRGRSSIEDVKPWRDLPGAEVSPHVSTQQLLARARAVLAPTRAEVHPLVLVEAAVRGIPIVCSDLPGTRAALGDSAVYLPAAAPAQEWAASLRDVLEAPPPRLVLRPYPEVVAEALGRLQLRRAA